MIPHVYVVSLGLMSNLLNIQSTCFHSEKKGGAAFGLHPVMRADCYSCHCWNGGGHSESGIHRLIDFRRATPKEFFIPN
jgi:hypothetical protein